eukprot:2799845-Amphidinium_carterae.1
MGVIPTFTNSKAFSFMKLSGCLYGCPLAVAVHTGWSREGFAKQDAAKVLCLQHQPGGESTPRTTGLLTTVHE